jgi:hypothetical protein
MSGSGSRPVGVAAVREALAVVRARALLLVLLLAIGLAAGAVFGASRDTSATYGARLGLYPLSQNQAAISLGVSTPVGPLSADIESDPVINDVATRTGIPAERLREEFDVKDVPFDVHQLALEASGVEEGESKRLLTTWIAAIQAQRRVFIGQRIEDARTGLRKELRKARSSAERKQVVEDLAALSALSSSLRSDVSVLRDPYRIVPVTHSTFFYVLVGGLIGGFAGVAIAMGVGLLDRRLRTPAAIAARFGLPVIADLRAEDGVATLRRRVELTGASPGPLVAVEVGDGESAARVVDVVGDGVSAKVVATRPLGDTGTIALLGSAGAWVYAASPGLTRSDQVDAAVTELGASALRPLGVVLV